MIIEDWFIEAWCQVIENVQYIHALTTCTGIYTCCAIYLFIYSDNLQRQVKAKKWFPTRQYTFKLLYVHVLYTVYSVGEK